MDTLKAYSKQPIFLFVFFPWLLYAFYLSVWASPRYESHAKVIIEQPNGMATMDPAMAMLTGLGVPGGSTDNHLVRAYILSADMLNYLDENLRLREHYTSTNVDIFSRLASDNTAEEFLEYYQNHVSVEVDDLSTIISINIQAFEPQYAQQLSTLLIKRSEWFINSIGHKLAKEQMAFINGEHDIVVTKLQDAKKNLLDFQRENKLLDPAAEGAALQQIAYSLESNISVKKAELKSLQLTMAENSPEIIATKDMIAALEKQLVEENKRISGDYSADNVATKLAAFSDYKIELELALQAYSSSLISLEKSRIEAYRKLQYLVTVESSTLPDDNQYPKVVYNLTLFAIILLLLFGIVKILIATIKELN
ncbi:lipopolysaccharide biosynthesis protein [Thalassotalea sp. LPB0316]|nr:lipopolysaccharide biosynthesis protein [Thalassotalea sp. LPB0316]